LFKHQVNKVVNLDNILFVCWVHREAEGNQQSITPALLKSTCYF